MAGKLERTIRKAKQNAEFMADIERLDIKIPGLFTSVVDKGLFAGVFAGWMIAKDRASELERI